MKSVFVLKTFDDDHFKNKLDFLSILEAAFDDYRNDDPPESYEFFAGDAHVHNFPFGRSIKITVELI